MSVSGLKRYLNGGDPTAGKILQLAERMEVSPSWLLTGHGPIIAAPGASVSDEKAISLLADIELPDHEARNKVKEITDRYAKLKDSLSVFNESTVEALGTARIFDPKEFSSSSFEALINDLNANIKDEFAFIPCHKSHIKGDGEIPTARVAVRRTWVREVQLDESQLTLIIAKGDSMEPTIHSNDLLIVDLSTTKPKDGHIYVFKCGDELFVRRFQNVLGSWRLISDNSIYDKVDVEPNKQSEFSVIGQVVQITKNLRN